VRVVSRDVLIPEGKIDEKYENRVRRTLGALAGSPGCANSTGKGTMVLEFWTRFLLIRLQSSSPAMTSAKKENSVTPAMTLLGETDLGDLSALDSICVLLIG
jgi:hypothetical protein